MRNIRSRLGSTAAISIRIIVAYGNYHNLWDTFSLIKCGLFSSIKCTLFS